MLARRIDMNISRRKFVGQAAAGVLSGAALARAQTEQKPAALSPGRTGQAPLIISTWPFGKPANEKALKVLQAGGSILDAVEQGIWVAETDPAVTSVGLNGKPNAAGVVQLDACIMHGPGHKGGSVAAIEGIRHPISAARLVMEKTKHVMLVGEGARMFALEQGLEAVETNSRELNEKWMREHPGPARRKKNSDNHDTIALLVLGADGNMAGGCSTSGLAGKLPGRVGDSPLLGSGLYVDNEVGAAGATGTGENVMRYCASFLIVEYMRQGMHPLEACRAVIHRIIRAESRGPDLSINFIALDKQGRFGAAGTDAGFQYAVATTGSSELKRNPGFESAEHPK